MNERTEISESVVKLSYESDYNTAVWEGNDSVGQYLQEIGKYKLLDASEEYELGVIIQQELPEEDDPSYERLKRLQDRAKERFTTSNLRLVVSVVKNYRNQGLSFSDLIQEGNLGLSRAVEKFDPYKGFKFSTYATWWIRQAAQRALADKNEKYPFRLPTHVYATNGQVFLAEAELYARGEENPSDEMIAEETGLDIKHVELSRRAMGQANPVSLDMPIDHGEGPSIGEIIVNQSDLSVEDEVIGEITANEFIDFFERIEMPENERKVVIGRFGLHNGGKKRTLDDIGQEINLTRERVRQLEGKGLARIRLAMLLNPRYEGRLSLSDEERKSILKTVLELT